ncbi:hypothetical protein V8E53_006621 [Lactarius tabidus]
MYDMAIYIARRIRPPLSTIKGNMFFDPHLDPFLHTSLVAFFVLCCGFASYTTIEVMYHIAMILGRVPLDRHLDHRLLMLPPLLAARTACVYGVSGVGHGLFLWGTFMLDGWTRHGLIACDFPTPRVRLGKQIADGIIALITNV